MTIVRTEMTNAQALPKAFAVALAIRRKKSLNPIVVGFSEEMFMLRNRASGGARPLQTSKLFSPQMHYDHDERNEEDKVNESAAMCLVRPSIQQGDENDGMHHALGKSFSVILHQSKYIVLCHPTEYAY